MGSRSPPGNPSLDMIVGSPCYGTISDVKTLPFAMEGRSGKKTGPDVPDHYES